MGVVDRKTLVQLGCRVCPQLHTTEIPIDEGAQRFRRRPRQLLSARRCLPVDLNWDTGDQSDWPRPRELA